MLRWPKPRDAEGRVKLSAYQLRKLRQTWWNNSWPFPTCGICEKFITRFDELTVDHIKPRGMGGGSRDDSTRNLTPAHFLCNSQKGSRRENR